MNVFFLDRDPIISAQLHSDQHVSKMTLETAQILCSVLHRHGLPAPYKLTHPRHPCVLWTGDSIAHWQWTRKFGLALGSEYSYRTGRIHASALVIKTLPECPPIQDNGWIDPPQAMPEIYYNSDTVAAYQAYYAGAKSNFAGKGPATWTKRVRPDFMP